MIPMKWSAAVLSAAIWLVMPGRAHAQEPVADIIQTNGKIVYDGKKL